MLLTIYGNTHSVAHLIWDPNELLKTSLSDSMPAGRETEDTPNIAPITEMDSMGEK